MEQIKNIMKEVYDHLMNGVLFHADMVDLFDFLYLKGFKKWQKNILEEELDNVTDMQHHFIKRHHMMLPPYQQHYESGLIPATWYGQTAMDISKEDIKATYDDLSVYAEQFGIIVSYDGLELEF